MTKNTVFFSCILLFASLIIFTSALRGNKEIEKKEKVNIILDTDMGPDYDDVGAIALLHVFADSGYVNILGTIACTKYEGVASVLNIFNTYFQRPDIPIGVPKGWALTDKDKQHWTDSLIANYPHTLKSNSQAQDAVKLYRKILSEQPDNSITIVSVGFFTNLNDLIHSVPDQYSVLNGRELIKKKIKRLVSMAGKFPAGKEFNVFKDSTSAHSFFKEWPKPVIFTGWEVGHQIKTGINLINNSKIQNSPVKDAYRIAIPKSVTDKDGRMSWDQTAILIAAKGYKDFFRLQPGNIIVNADGSNTWISNKKGSHGYVKLETPPDILAHYIEHLMMQPPKKQ